MSQEYNLHGIQVIIKRKKVRNINLKVNQLGQVILSCPNKIGEKIIQDFLESKHEWIKNSIEKLSAGNKFYNKRYEEGEVHFLFGEPLILKIHPESKSKSKIEKEDCNLIMRIKSGKSIKTKEKHLQEWYKNILLMESQKYFTKWEKILEVSKHELIVKKMRGKWGYCDYKKRKICLNLELTKRNLLFVEYVILHELCHLIVPNHGPLFKKLLNEHMPDWRKISKNE